MHTTRDAFLSELQDRLKSVFSTHYTDAHATERGMPEGFLETVMEAAPLSVFIPERFGGRGQRVEECLAMLETCSYESLPLSLAMGINGALFLQPLTRYGREEVQTEVFKRFLNHGALGGLMITEPDYGSDALQMQTRFRSHPRGYHLQGTKHWGGLTGQADYWMLTARGETERGDLERAISFFVWDRSLGGVDVEEYYPNLGIYMLPYGLNRIDTVIPEERRLTPQSSGVRMLLDLLHRSRLQFPGMAMGYLRRLLDEAIVHTRTRLVGGRPLRDYDQVQDRLAEIQSSYTICSAMCAFSTGTAGVDRDCSSEALPANSIKTVITDLMQAAAQSFLQLVGAKGYRLDHLAGRSVVDSRPFQIFEGSNDILYQQISEAVLKAMEKTKESNLFRYLSSFELTSRAADCFRTALDITPDRSLPQRKMVDLGRALGRIISMQMVIDLGDRGYRRDLVDNALAVLRRETGRLLCSFSDEGTPLVVEDYREDSSWLRFLPG
ncbi:MAG: acyl-CoA dehydrogenase [Spirochaetaceae bacterium]|nr:MAG: acyl-CoA dehydrogenase [Spirochaetaceae bacterium]